MLETVIIRFICFSTDNAEVLKVLNAKCSLLAVRPARSYLRLKAALTKESFLGLTPAASCDHEKARMVDSG